MTRECVYCGIEYIDGELICDKCGGSVRNVGNYNHFIHGVGDEKYNNIDNALESKRCTR